MPRRTLLQIGIAIVALALGFVLARQVIQTASAPPPQAAQANNTEPRTPTRPNTASALEAEPGGSSDAWLRPYVGEWYGHGYGATISSGGTGHLDYRTYDECPPDTPGVPCETQVGEDAGRVDFQLIQHDNEVLAHVVKSNDVTIQGDLPIQLLQEGAFIIKTPDERYVFGLCRQGINLKICGGNG